MQTQAYLLHSRDYTDSRILVELFSVDCGRISAVLRARSTKKSTAANRPRQAMQAFTLHTVEWRGSSALKTLTMAEAQAPALILAGEALYCGIYLNELLCRLLPVDDACADLFARYQCALQQLQQAGSVRARLEVVLREFELALLAELGYAIDFCCDALGNTIDGSGTVRYRYQLGRGFVALGDMEHGVTGKSTENSFSATTLAAAASGDFQRAEVRAAIKRLCRRALAPLLGNRPLKSRELFGAVASGAPAAAPPSKP